MMRATSPSPAAREAYTDYTDVRVDENSAVKVYVRLRPPAGAQKSPAKQFEVDEDDPGRIALKTSAHGQHAFRFQHAFGTETDQGEVFREVAQPLVDHVLSGYNACVFAYGQTGSGKTHTLFGPEGAVGGESRGLIPRSVEYIFSQLRRHAATKEGAVVVSFLEIYRDQVRDLGRASSSKGHEEDTTTWYRKLVSGRGTFSRDGAHVTRGYDTESLEIREDANGQVFVRGLSLIPVNSAEEALGVVRDGFALRATHETHLNSVSSRSHTVFTLHVLQRDKTTGDATQGMLHLVDLAGSERLRRSHSEGDRRAEALSINSSLTALGKVVMSLHESTLTGSGPDLGLERGGTAGEAVGPHIPYRDSKLTRILQNSLGGNAFLSLVAAVHPREIDAEESLSTLMFAHRCRFVPNKPRVNYSLERPEEKDRRIRRLEAECALLRRLLALSRVTGRLRIARLMADLGVKGALTSDGRWRMPDGTIVGVTADQAARSDWARREANRELAPGGALSEAATSAAAAAAAASAAGGGGPGSTEHAGSAASEALLLAEGPSGRGSVAESGSIDGHSPPLEELLALPADASEARSRGLAPGDRVGGEFGSGVGRGTARGPVTGLVAPSLSLRHSEGGWEDEEGETMGTGGMLGGSSPIRGGSKGGVSLMARARGAVGQAGSRMAASAAVEKADYLRDKVRELKRTLEKEREANRVEQERLRRTAREAESEAKRALEEAAEAKRVARDAADEQSATYSQQVAGVLTHNQRLLAQSHELLLAVPRALRVSSKQLEDVGAAEERVRREEEARRRRDVSNAVVGARAELDAERQRFRAALTDAEAEHARAVATFSDWSARAKERQAQLESELRHVWTYATGLAALLRDIEGGAVPVHVAASGRRAFHLPADMIPEDPFESHPTGLRALRGMLGSDGAALGGTLARSIRPSSSASTSKKKRNNKSSKALDRNSTLASTLSLSRAVDAGTRPRTSGGTGLPQQPWARRSRPHSSASSSNALLSAPELPASRLAATLGLAREEKQDSDSDHEGDVQAPTGDEDEGTFDDRLAKLARDIERRGAKGDVDLDTRVEDMSAEELRAHVRALRNFVQSGAQSKAEDALLNDLAEEDATDWVRRVAMERDAARRRLAEERERNKELRTAYAAMRRQADKAQRAAVEAKARHVATKTALKTQRQGPGPLRVSRPPEHRGGWAAKGIDDVAARAFLSSQ